jgi:hypothetical protein
MEEKFQVTTSIWSENIENVLREIQDNCQGYKIMNIEAATSSAKRYNLVLYTLIATGPIAGILSAVSVIYDDYAKGIQIVVSIFSFIAGAISSIIKYSKLEQKIASYKTIATKYASLEGNIQRQLSLDRQDRVNAGEYLQWISNSFDDLFNSTPLMPNDVYQKWLKIAEKKKIRPQETVINIEKKTELPDVHQYSDGQMQYQMKRLHGNF